MLTGTDRIIDVVRVGLGSGRPNVPKILAMQRRGFASCQDFFRGFVHNALRAIQSLPLPPLSDLSNVANSYSGAFITGETWDMDIAEIDFLFWNFKM